MNITQWLLRFLSPLSGVKLNNNFTRTGWCNPKCRLPGAMARTAHLAVLSLAYHGTSSLGMRQQLPSGACFLTLHNLTAGRQRTLNLFLVNEHELCKTILHNNNNNNNNNNYYYYYYRRRRRHYHHHHHHHHPRYLLYAGYLHLNSWDKPCPWGKLCCNYSDVTIHGAYIATSCVDSIVSLR